jgi:hypothetical protein
MLTTNPTTRVVRRRVAASGYEGGSTNPTPLVASKIAYDRADPEARIPRGSDQKRTYTSGYRSLTALGACPQRLLPTALTVLPIQKTLQAAKAMPASARRVTSNTGSNLTSSAEMRM